MAGDATIELLKGYEPKKMEFPAILSEKLDGVPVIIRRRHDGGYEAITRQGESIGSINHILDNLRARGKLLPGAFLVGELYIPGVPFKDISGKVRKFAPAVDLIFNIFDGDLYPHRNDRKRYDERMSWIVADIEQTHCVKIIPYVVVGSPAEVTAEFMQHMEVFPKSEGMVVHSCAKQWSPGKRCWGTQRIKPEPTIDLEVESYEEAVDQFDQPKAMVGRINVRYDRMVKGCGMQSTVIGIGPGALSHNERRDLWDKYKGRSFVAGAGPIIEVKYMTDETYDALRQPTFVRFRPDKNEADVHLVG